VSSEPLTKVKAARRELEAAMRAASDAGIALRPIAKAAGLSVEWTRRLIAEGT
jgi:D-serine deaminase-like pyridoxal phosphate-dependent protein